MEQRKIRLLRRVAKIAIGFFESRNPKQTHTRLINHINAATETRFHRKNCARRCRVGCVLGDNKEGSSSTTSPSRQADRQCLERGIFDCGNVTTTGQQQRRTRFCRVLPLESQMLIGFPGPVGSHY